MDDRLNQINSGQYANDSFKTASGTMMYKV